MSSRRKGAIDNSSGRVIAAHGVDRDTHQQIRSCPLSCGPVRQETIEAVWSLFVNGTHLPLSVVSTVGADSMRGLRFTALRARARGGLHELIVSAALTTPLLGMSTLGIGHGRMGG